MLASNTVVEPLFAEEFGPDNKVIFSSWNVLPVLVSIVQILKSCVTLYRSQGDQLDQYGYATFGLTVLPYMVMSMVNLIGNIFTTTYPRLYLVRSPKMEEAESRGGVFYGCIGRVVARTHDDGKYSSTRVFRGVEDGHLLLSMSQFWRTIVIRPKPRLAHWPSLE